MSDGFDEWLEGEYPNAVCSYPYIAKVAYEAGHQSRQPEVDELRGEISSLHAVYEQLSNYIFGTDHRDFAERHDGVDALYAKLRKEMGRHEEDHMSMDCRDMAN